MKRADAIAYLRVAGYHEDSGEFVRLYVENRISHASAKQAFNEGRAMRVNGVKCTCRECAEVKT